MVRVLATDGMAKSAVDELKAKGCDLKVAQTVPDELLALWGPTLILPAQQSLTPS